MRVASWPLWTLTEGSDANSLEAPSPASCSGKLAPLRLICRSLLPSSGQFTFHFISLTSFTTVKIAQLPGISTLFSLLVKSSNGTRPRTYKALATQTIPLVDYTH